MPYTTNNSTSSDNVSVNYNLNYYYVTPQQYRRLVQQAFGIKEPAKKQYKSNRIRKLK